MFHIITYNQFNQKQLDMDKSTDNTHGFLENNQPINQPVQDRECTDLICCILFIVAAIATLGCASYGWDRGHPSELFKLYDSTGNPCKDTFFKCNIISIDAYFIMPIPNYFQKVICVSQCPTQQNQILNCFNSVIQKDNYCRKLFLLANGFIETYPSDATLLSAAASPGSAVSIVYKSQPFAQLLCIPDNYTISATDIFAQCYFDQLDDLSFLAQTFTDIKLGWPVFLGSMFTAFIFGLIYMFILRYCAGVFTWISILGYLVGIFALAIYLITTAQQLQKQKNFTQQDTVNKYKAGSIIAFIIGVLSIMAIICLYKKIRLAVGVIKSAGLFIGQVCQIIFLPIVVNIITITVVVIYFLIFVFLYAVGDINTTGATPFATVTQTDNTKVMLYFIIFMAIWMFFLLQALSDFIVASSAAIWYFSDHLYGQVHSPVSRSIWRAIRYHFGSIAFGSIILAIIFSIQILFELFQKFYISQTQNACVKIAMKCCSCCLSCLRYIVQIINQGAYIQIAIKGTNFCTSAKESFKLMMQNPLRLSITFGLSFLIMIIGVLFISSLNTLLAYILFQNVQYFQKLITSSVLGCAIILMISALIAVIYMQSYSMASKTILQSFIIDQGSQRMKNQQARFCPQPLRQIYQNQ